MDSNVEGAAVGYVAVLSVTRRCRRCRYVMNEAATLIVKERETPTRDLIISLLLDAPIEP